MNRVVIIVLLGVVAMPAAFWLRYQTLDPCDALASRAAIETGTRPSQAMLRAFLDARGMTQGDCLQSLWRAETGWPYRR